MNFGAELILSSLAFGVALAMDAFSVSLANGLNEPCMKKRKMCGIAGIFAFFQALMPMIGWLCVHTIVQYFTAVARFVPFIAFAVLAFVGGKMLYEGIKGGEEECTGKAGLSALLVQGIATSIDALSTGFEMVDYGVWQALCSAGIIAAVTFVICLSGVLIGRKFGTKLAGKAGVLGGCILLLIAFKSLAEGIAELIIG